MKRILSFCMALFMVISLVTIPAIAEGKVAFAAETVEAKPGQTVDVPVTVNGSNFELHTLDLTAEYDADALTLNGVTKGKTLADASLEALDDTTPGEVNLKLLCAESGLTAKGTLFTLHFTVNEGVTASQTIKITVNEAAKLTSSGEAVAVANNVYNGKIDIAADNAVKDDAANLDEALNVKDGKLEFTNDSKYPWTVKDNYAVSTNKVDNTESKITVNVPDLEGDICLSFLYMVSSEEYDADKLIVYADADSANPLFKLGGNYAQGWKRCNVKVPANAKTITFAYSKDRSSSENADEAYLDEVSITKAETLKGVKITNAIDGVITVKMGEFGQIEWNTEPANALYTLVDFTPDSWSKANVNSKYGFITPKMAGDTKVTLTLTDADGEVYKDECTVRVVEASEEITIKLEPAVLTIPVTYTKADSIVATVEGNYNGKLVWSSSNSDVVTAAAAITSPDGKVGEIKSLATGTVTVTVKTEDGSASATATVKVVGDEDYLPQKNTEKFQTADFDKLKAGIEVGIGRDGGGIPLLIQKRDEPTEDEPNPEAYTHYSYASGVTYTAKAGETVRFFTEKKDTDLDTYLTLYDENFNVVLTNDDGATNSPFSEISCKFEKDGTYYLVVSQAAAYILNAKSIGKLTLKAETATGSNIPSVGPVAPETDTPDTDTPDTDAPNTDAPNTDKPSEDMVTIKLEVNNEITHPGEIGYQILFDPTHNLYGKGNVIDPSSNILCQPENAQDVYNKFGYTIPANAKEGIFTNYVTHLNSDTIQIPAGTYDLAVVIPYDNHVKILQSMEDLDGMTTLPGALDNFTFEAGKEYRFYVFYYMFDDCVDLYIDNKLYVPGQTQEPQDPSDTPTATPKPTPQPDDVVFSVNAPDDYFQPGDEFTATIAVSGADYKAHLLGLNLIFDSTVFEVVGKPDETDAFGDVDMMPYDSATSNGWVFSYLAANDPVTYKGDMWTITFKVLGNIADGDYELGLNLVDFMYDDNQTDYDIPCFLEGATIHIGEKPSVSPSDNPPETPANPPAEGNAKVILSAEDYWEDGTGYQMLLDSKASTYNVIFPDEYGMLGSRPGSDFSDLYGKFDHTIPQNLTGDVEKDPVIIDDSVTIEIPAGIYDYAIVNPDYYDGTLSGEESGWDVYLVTNYGPAFGYADNFVFEAGKTYEFHVHYDTADTGLDIVDLYIDGVHVERPLRDDIENGWSFENDPFDPSIGWTVESYDEDSYNWRWLSSGLWNGYIVPPYDGQGMVVSESFNLTEGLLTPDNWLISPEFTSGDEFSFYAASLDPDYPEYMEVYVRLPGGDWIPEMEMPIDTDSFRKYTLDTSDYEGATIQVAFRHYMEESSTFVMLDYVQYSGGSEQTPSNTPQVTPSQTPEVTPSQTPEITPSITPTQEPQIPNDGDIDGDGKVTTEDALVALRGAMGLMTLNDEQIAHADVDGDGRLTTEDALLIVRASMGLLEL